MLISKDFGWNFLNFLSNNIIMNEMANPVLEIPVTRSFAIIVIKRIKFL